MIQFFINTLTSNVITPEDKVLGYFSRKIKKTFNMEQMEG